MLYSIGGLFDGLVNAAMSEDGHVGTLAYWIIRILDCRRQPYRWSRIDHLFKQEYSVEMWPQGKVHYLEVIGDQYPIIWWQNLNKIHRVIPITEVSPSHWVLIHRVLPITIWVRPSHIEDHIEHSYDLNESSYTGSWQCQSEWALLIHRVIQIRIWTSHSYTQGCTNYYHNESFIYTTAYQ